MLQTADAVGALARGFQPIDTVRRYRNSWKGHGGHIKASDAEKLDNDLHQSIRDLYEVAAPIFRRVLLVRPGKAEVADSGFKFELEKLVGSDPTFSREFVELDRPTKSNALAFWMSGSRTACKVLPFFRFGAPERIAKSSLYVFNRVADGQFRWVSYQETREQESSLLMKSFPR